MKFRAFTTIFLLVACTPPKPSNTASDSDGGSSSSSETDGGSLTDGASVTSASSTPGTDSTPGSDSTPTTASSVPTTDAPETSGDTAVTGTSAAPGSSTDTGNDTEGGGLVGACADMCAKWIACGGAVGSMHECAAACIMDFSDPPECAAAATAQWECAAQQSCEEALKFLDGTPSTCLEEVGATDQACSDQECGGEVGGDMQTCELMQECGEGKQEYVCDTEICTCKQDGVPGNECPSEGFCMLDHDAQHAAITACCGWVWEI